MKFNRLVSFQNSAEKLSRYRTALAILYELGVDQLLIEQSYPHTVPDGHPNIIEANALANRQMLGFRECIDALFTLDKIDIPDAEKVQPDYGAIDRLIEKGLVRPEDKETFLKDIE